MNFHGLVAHRSAHQYRGGRWFESTAAHHGKPGNEAFVRPRAFEPLPATRDGKIVEKLPAEPRTFIVAGCGPSQNASPAFDGDAMRL